MKHCCKIMRENVNMTCEIHKDNIFQCPDKIIYCNQEYNEYGIIIHDGGESYIEIHYCPWCGKKLPEPKRKKYD